MAKKMLKKALKKKWPWSLNVGVNMKKWKGQNVKQKKRKKNNAD